MPEKEQMTFFRVAVPTRHFVKRGKKKILQKMWERYSWVWVNTGLCRLFQKLASHVCVIFFFFSLSLSLFGILSSVLFWAPQHSSFIPFVSRRRTSSWKASSASTATVPLSLWPLEPLITWVCWFVASLLFQLLVLPEGEKLKWGKSARRVSQLWPSTAAHPVGYIQSPYF